MSARWREATADNDYALVCPGCSDTVPEVLLCIHDAQPTGPLCPACCEDEHPHQCRACRGAGSTRREIFNDLGRIAFSDKPEDLIVCLACDGSGRMNEGSGS